MNAKCKIKMYEFSPLAKFVSTGVQFTNGLDAFYISIMYLAVR